MRVGACVLVAVFSSVAHGQYLMTPDPTNSRVVIIDAFDGHVVNSALFHWTPDDVNGPRRPVEALQVGDEIWMGDATGSGVWRFDGKGAFLGSIGAGGEIDDVRGMELVGETLYVTVGQNSSSYHEGIVTIDITTQQITGQLVTALENESNFWDIELYGNELLVSDSGGNDALIENAIRRYALDGTYLGNFAESDGASDFDGLAQLASRASNGNLLGAGVSTPTGVYEWQPDGTPLGRSNIYGVWGVAELGNGDVIYSRANFGGSIRTDSQVFLTDGQFHMFSETTIPAPGAALTLCGLTVLTSMRRRS